MSRRARLEAQRELEAQEELQREEERQKAKYDRIFSAITWNTYPNGIRIQDLMPKHYEMALEIIKEYYIPEEVLARNSGVKEDQVSLDSYLDRMLFVMKDKKSIIAFDESKEDAIAGLMLIKEYTESGLDRTFSRVQICHGEAHEKIIKFTNAVTRHVNIWETFDCNRYLRYYLLCILPEYQDTPLAYRFFQTGFQVARSLDLKTVVGVFSDYQTQKIATRFNMRILKEIMYTRWLTKDGHLIFCAPGPGNYTCALMGGLVPPPPEPEPPPPPTEEEIEALKKMTRIEKRAMKIKQKEQAEKMAEKMNEKNKISK